MRTKFRSPDQSGLRRLSAPAMCVLAAVSLLGACDRSSNQADGGEVRTASAEPERPSLEEVCGLLKPAEVEAVLGTKVGKPREPPLPTRVAVGMRECTYGDPRHGEITVGLAWVFGEAVFKKAVQKLEAEQTAMVPVRNLGDEAVAFFGGFLLVREDRFVLYVAITRGEGPGLSRTEAAPMALRETSTRVALSILRRLR